MGALTGGLIDLEISKIISGSKEDVGSFTYEVWLHTVDRDIKLTLLQQVEVLRNYNMYTGDFIAVEFSIEGGTFVKDIFVNKDNLEMTIIKKYNTSKNKEDLVGRYKFIILNHDGNINASQYSKMSRETLNQTYMINVKGQCILRELEGLRSLNVDGIYKNTTLKDLIIAEFSNASSKMTLEGNPLDIRFTMVDADNNYIYKNLIVPTGINLIDLPSYLQNSDYGIYNGAIGTYMQMVNNKPTLYIYPLYNTKRYDDITKRMIVYHTNTSRFDFVERTYSTDGDLLKILAGGNTTSYDTGDNDLSNTGDAIISNIPEQIMGTAFQVTDDKITLDKNTLLRGASVKERRDGVMKSVYLGAESNLYKYRAKFIRNTMANYQVKWNYGDIDLIYPGMPVCFVYEDETEGIMELKGIVQGCYNRFSMSQKVNTGILQLMVMKPNVYLANKN